MWVGFWFHYFDFLTDVFGLHNFIFCKLIHHDPHTRFLLANMGLCGIRECVELGWGFEREEIIVYECTL